MRLGDFSALTFDCYGTLIDWETGILAALRPWAAATGSRPTMRSCWRRSGGPSRAVRPPTRRRPTRGSWPASGGPRRGARHHRQPRGGGGVRRLGEGLAGVPRQPGGARLPPAALQAGDRLQRRPRLLRPSNARLGVTFDAVVTADDAGAYKPAPNHFQLALAQLAEMGVPGPGPARRPEPVPRPRPRQAARPANHVGQPPRRPRPGRRRHASPPRCRSHRTARSRPWPPWRTAPRAHRLTPPGDDYLAPPGPHRLGPTNSSSSATLPRLATDRLHRLFGRHSIPSWSQARPKIPRMSADTLLKW